MTPRHLAAAVLVRLLAVVAPALVVPVILPVAALSIVATAVSVPAARLSGKTTKIVVTVIVRSIVRGAAALSPPMAISTVISARVRSCYRTAR